MRNQQLNNNAPIPNLRSDKRIDALLKQEMIEHKHVISCHEKEMQSLRDSLSLAIQKFESLSQQGLQEIRDFKRESGEYISSIKDRVTDYETIIAEQKKIIEDVNRQLLDFHVNYAKKTDLQNLKKSIEERVQDVSKNNIMSFQQCQQEFKFLFDSLKDYSLQLRYHVDLNLSQLTDKVESNFSVSRIDKDGVLNQIRIYEKTIFIIEKKIENIYTLIERINKRGDALCHKPE